MKEAITDLQTKDFEEFASKVKVSLDDKLRNNPVMVQAQKDREEYTNTAAAFAKISEPTPVEPETTVEPEAPKEEPTEPAE
jgi:hypothetical protein